MVDFITGVIGSILYPLFSIIFLALDTVQGIFMALAGIGGTIHISDETTGLTWGGEASTITNGNTGEPGDSGLIFYLLNSSIAKNLLMSITMLALFLLIIFTVMAFIKNVYAAKQKSWQEIIASSLKGLLSFVFIPVCCLLGVWVSNIILQAINSATSTGGSKMMSKKVFIAAAYNANKYRTKNLDDKGEKAKEIHRMAFGENEPLPQKGENEDDYSYWARVVDDAYGNKDNSNINIYLYGQVEHGYTLFQINYFVIAIVGVFMAYVLITLAYAMVRRMFILLMLFVISPAICAMYPLDDGSAVGQWRKNFISTTIGAYGAVAGMNIFLSLLPIIETMGFTFASNSAASPLVDELIQLFMMVAGLFIVKEMMQMISGYVGGDDAYSKGSGLRASTKGAIKKKVAGTVGVFTKAAADKSQDKSFIGSLLKQGGQSMLNSVGVNTKDIRKTYNDRIKSTDSDRAEKNKMREEREIKKQASQLLHDKGVVKSSGVENWFNDDRNGFTKFMSGIGRGVKHELGFSGVEGVDFDKLKELLKDPKVAQDPKLQQALMDEYARYSNLATGRIGTAIHHEGVPKDAKFGEKLKDFFSGVRDFVADDQKVETGESIKKKIDKDAKGTAGMESLGEVQLNIDKLDEQMQALSVKFADVFGEKFLDKVDNRWQFKDPSKDHRSDIAWLDNEAHKEGATPEAMAAYEEALKANPLFEEFDKITARQESAANNFESILRASAENFGKELQAAALEAADALKNATLSGTSGAELATVIGSKMQEVLKATNKDDKEIAKQLKKLIEELGGKKDGGGAGKP